MIPAGSTRRKQLLAGARTADGTYPSRHGIFIFPLEMVSPPDTIQIGLLPSRAAQQPRDLAVATAGAGCRLPSLFPPRVKRGSLKEAGTQLRRAVDCPGHGKPWPLLPHTSKKAEVSREMQGRRAPQRSHSVSGVAGKVVDSCLLLPAGKPGPLPLSCWERGQDPERKGSCPLSR